MSEPPSPTSAAIGDEEASPRSQSVPMSKMSLSFLLSARPPSAVEPVAAPGKLEDTVNSNIPSTSSSRPLVMSATDHGASQRDMRLVLVERIYPPMRSAHRATNPRAPAATLSQPLSYDAPPISQPPLPAPLGNPEDGMDAPKEGNSSVSASNIHERLSSSISPALTTPVLPVATPSISQVSPVDASGTLGPIRRVRTIRHTNSGGFRNNYDRIDPNARVKRTGLDPSPQTMAARVSRNNRAAEAQQLDEDIEAGTRTVEQLAAEVQDLQTALERKVAEGQQCAANISKANERLRILIGWDLALEEYDRIEHSVRHS